MTYGSYLYVWIYYYTHQYLSINFETKKLEIPSKFDFRLRFSDFDKMFLVMNSKYGNLNMDFLKILYYSFIKVIFKGSCFELEKLGF
jgi:hypothetical protein